MTQSEFMVNIIDKENQINEEILNYKQHDYNKIIDILSIICKSIEIIPEIKFDYIELLDDEFENDKMVRNIQITNTRVVKLRLHFYLVDINGNPVINDKTSEPIKPTIDLLIPRMIDGSFILYDVNYYPMLQILDYKSLVKENLTTIKTLINKMRMEVKKSRKKQHRVELELFRRKDMPLWLVLFSIYNPMEAMKRVFRTDDIQILSISDVEDTEAENIVIIEDKAIKIGNSITEIISKEENKDFTYSIQIMVESLREFFNDKNVIKFTTNYALKTPLDEFMKDSEPFIEILGSYYSTNINKFITKGNNVCHSLNRFLDEISKKYMEVNDMLEMYMKELERINQHNIALKENDEETIELNMANNLLNKRLRMSEYVIFPFTKKLSENIHSVLNGNTKDDIRINKILNIFKIDKNIIVKNLLTNNLIRYNDQSNMMTAIANTKASFVTGETSNNISNSLRMIPQTGLGRIDLITTPTGGSLGLTVNLSATRKNLVDKNGCIQ